MRHSKLAIRTTSIIAAAAGLAVVLAGCTPPSTTPPEQPALEVPDKPSAAVTLNIIDGGGKIAVEDAINRFVAANPDVISGVTWESASEGDIAGALKPQVDSGNLQVDLVITGTSGLAAGIDNNLWVPIAKDYADRLGNMANYIEPAKKLQELTQGYGATVVWCYCGPTITYNPQVVTGDLPKTTDELLKWAEANPGKFGYSRPANSGVGRTFLLALPHILGDEDLEDPSSWDKTWSYLQELGKYIDNYPTSTSQAMTNLAEGTWTLMPSSAGWDVGPRARGQVPAFMEAYALDNTTWVMDPNYAMVPRGVSADKLSAILLLLNYLLTPEGNATAGTGGQYVPGIVVEGVTDDMIPSATKDLLAEFSRDWFEDEFYDSDNLTPPSQDVVVEALDLWDRKVGTGN